MASTARGAPPAAARRAAAASRSAAGRSPADLDAPLAGLPGIAARRAELYAAAGLRTQRQLLYHLPVRYRLRPPARTLAEQMGPEARDPEVRAQEAPADGSAAGSGPVSDSRPAPRAALAGTVRRASVRRRGRRSTVTLLLDCDGGGEASVLLFNRAYLAKSLPRGTRLWAAGSLEAQESGPPRLIAADYEPLPADGEPLPSLPPRPIYRLPAGIPPRVHRKLLAAVLGAGPVADWRVALGGGAGIGLLSGAAGTDGAGPIARPSLDVALRAIHLPVDVASARVARSRLAHDEALALSLDVAARRRRLGAARATGLPIDEARHAALLGWLPHAPTAAQLRAIRAVRADLAGTAAGAPAGRPMARLLQGDVGSGKTLVAFYALLAALAAGRQGALMAPTAILAAQHVGSLRALLARAFGVAAPAVALLAGDGDPERDRQARQALASGAAALAVGTHALQTARVRFRDLAVTVVDEQHRFGVMQRSRFRDKGPASHLLVMTATPIPRTLALTAYGELDVSVLDELPPGRAPRRTELVPPARQPAMWRALAGAVADGQRGYVVCPSIAGNGAPRAGALRAGAPAAGARGEDETSGEDGTSVAAMLQRVRRALGPSVAVGAVHGRMPAAERDAALDAFRGGRLAVLVATVLVEVGLDVPEATFVVVPDASRFGLATLHQVRGRVGRAARPGRCLLLGPVREPLARQRVAALLASEDGFRLAEQDLLLRGPGELLGTRQSGLPGFCVLDPVADVAVLADAREEAFALARPLADAALSALRDRVFPAMELSPENLLAGG